MKHDLRTVRRGRSIACVVTIGLACIGVLSPVVASAAERSGDERDNDKRASLTGLGLTPMPFMGTGVAINVEQLDQSTPKFKPNKGESRTLSEAEAKQLRMLADSALSSMMASGGSFASGTMGTHYDFEAHGISRQLVNLSFEYGSNQTQMMIQQGEPDNPELSALLDYLFKLYE